MRKLKIGILLSLAVLISCIGTYFMLTLFDIIKYKRMAESLATYQVDIRLHALEYIKNSKERELIVQYEKQLARYPLFVKKYFGINRLTAYYILKIQDYCISNKINIPEGVDKVFEESKAVPDPVDSDFLKW